MIPAARFGAFGESAVISSYGPMGAGKSTDSIRAFSSGLFLFPPGGLKPAVRLGFSLPQPDGTYIGNGPRLWAVPVTTLREVREKFRAVLRLPDMDPKIGPEIGKKPPSIVIDDGSILCTNTLIQLKADGVGDTKGGNYEGRLVFGALVEELKETRKLIRGAPINVMLNFHERLPSTDNERGKGHFHPGGPDVGTQYQTDVVPYISDLVLEARKEAARLPWPGVYVCDPNDMQKGHKDRFSIAPRKGPMNVGELLRAAGYWVPRPAGLEWLDEAAEAIAQDIAGGGNRSMVMGAWCAKFLNAGVTEAITDWAVQDGADRAEIRSLARAERLNAMGVKQNPDGSFQSVRG